MTDGQIIKALEICKTNTCKGCSYYEEYQSGVKCLCNLIRDALDLIIRQKAKIENEIKEIKSEAIKEFAERLKSISIGLEIGDDKKIKMMVVSTTAIDNIAKEMTEVKENEKYCKRSLLKGGAE